MDLVHEVDGMATECMRAQESVIKVKAMMFESAGMLGVSCIIPGMGLPDLTDCPCKNRVVALLRWVVFRHFQEPASSF